MNSILFILDQAPYGTEKAFGALNAAAVSLSMGVAICLYADGVYLALDGQESVPGVPNLSQILYAYPEIRVLAHEPSLASRGLLGLGLLEMVELLDHQAFLETVEGADCALLI